MALQQLRAAIRAFFVEGDVGLKRFLGTAREPPRRLAIRITRACEERAESPTLDYHLFAAVIAILCAGVRFGIVAGYIRKIASVIALRILIATKEKAMTAYPLE